MPNSVKILLVDDNPMVLGLLHSALTALASVTTSSDTADALLKAVDDGKGWRPSTRCWGSRLACHR